MAVEDENHSAAHEQSDNILVLLQILASFWETTTSVPAEDGKVVYNLAHYQAPDGQKPMSSYLLVNLPDNYILISSPDCIASVTFPLVYRLRRITIR